MGNKFDKQLELLHLDLTKMGALCETSIALVMKALINPEEESLEKISELEHDTDQLERSIESLCLKLLLQQQPVARDLRQISAALKMITDMERIGDQSYDIAEIIPDLKGRTSEEFQEIQKMAEETSRMVVNSVEAFVHQDVAIAEKVIENDYVVDDYFNAVKGRLIQMIKDNRSDGECALDLLMISKYFERIGDHATNIAEWVLFSITGIHKEG